jgi:hypothetical protein
MYHAGWAWAGNTPFHYTKLIASHFGGTRNLMVISWPNGIKPDKTPRAQFHHVNDIALTIYELIGIKPPRTGGWPPPSALCSPGWPARLGWPLGIRPRTNGSSTTSTLTSPKPMISPPSNRSG